MFVSCLEDRRWINYVHSTLLFYDCVESERRISRNEFILQIRISMPSRLKFLPWNSWSSMVFRDHLSATSFLLCVGSALHLQLLGKHLSVIVRAFIRVCILMIFYLFNNTLCDEILCLKVKFYQNSLLWMTVSVTFSGFWTLIICSISSQ